MGAFGVPRHHNVAKVKPFTPSERQKDVLRVLALGLSNDEIADVLSMTKTTVRTHLETMFEKTLRDNRTALVVLALARGWIRNPDLEEEPMQKET